VGRTQHRRNLLWPSVANGRGASGSGTVPGTRHLIQRRGHCLPSAPFTGLIMLASISNGHLGRLFPQGVSPKAPGARAHGLPGHIVAAVGNSDQ